MNPSSWTPPRDKTLTRDQVKRVLAAAKGSQAAIGGLFDYTFFAVCANTGLRVSEVAHLRRDGLLLSNADCKEAQISVIRLKKKEVHLERVDIASALEKILRDFLDIWKESEFVFPGGTRGCSLSRKLSCPGNHISVREMQRRWDYYLRKVRLKVEGRGIHMLRHYAVTEFYEKHRDLRAAQLFAGHSSSTITERYAHVVEMREKIRAVEPTV
jgi:integrase